MIPVTTYRKYHIWSILNKCQRIPSDDVYSTALSRQIHETLLPMLSTNESVKLYPILLEPYDYRMIGAVPRAVTPDAYLVADNTGVAAVATIERCASPKPACSVNVTQYYDSEKNVTFYYRWHAGYLCKSAVYWLIENQVIRNQVSLYNTELNELFQGIFEDTMRHVLQAIPDDYAEIN